MKVNRDVDNKHLYDICMEESTQNSIAFVF